ncbi:unnamed protein product [Rotaria sordida]|uniref:AIG1-type G domain-containing protein n=1 Tax=Rotaria sordida TaxID=392033 RepID=A0A815LHW4_9BILA|nr:unnamed protein product [Rotaria sordida]
MISSQNEMRIVLIGRTGNGKSSTGNSLLHSRSAFHATQSGRSITRDCQVARYQYTDTCGQRKALTGVDTPGFFDTDTSITNEIVERKIASQIFEMTAPGVHAFLIVIRIGRFTPEEKNTVDFIRHIFGPDAVRYCIVVFTAEDQLDEGQSLEDFINTAPALRELVRACGNRTFAINNKLNGDPLAKKTNRLIEIIDNMIRNNNGTYYTNAEYQRIERQRQEEKRRREEEERRKKKAEEDALIVRAKEEERKKAEQEIRKIRAEEQRKREEEQRKREEDQRKAEQRERELRNELDSAQRSRRRNSDDDNSISLVRALQTMGLGNAMPPMCSGGMGMPFSPMSSGMSMPFSSMNSGMDMPSPSMRSASSGIGGAHGGRFTGTYMATSGAANGRPIYEGPRGGQYHMTPGGHRSYVRK